MYYKRHIESTIKKAAGMFSAVLVTGARQVGKTSVLKESTKGLSYVTLDDQLVLEAARNAPGTFLLDNTPPVFIDEIQYAPQLFPYIKMRADEEGRNGLFYLSGSQQFQMMKNVSESLAGRLGILNLAGLSLREINKDSFTDIFIPSPDYFEKRKNSLKKLNHEKLWEIIQRGSMPKLYAEVNSDWLMFYSAYVKTYIERDVHDLSQVGDSLKFIQFMTSVAGRTGQLLNMSSIASDIGISIPTVDRWLSILISSGIIFLLRPYSNNMIKRAVKTPKLYFLDTGLAAYLLKWNTRDVLKNGAMAGAFFETFVISEIIKSFYNNGIIDPPLYFYRDKEKNEIDLIIEHNRVLHPIEIKKHADPRPQDIKSFNVIDKIQGVKRGSGGIICLYDKIISLSETDKVIPVSFI